MNLLEQLLSRFVPQGGGVPNPDEMTMAFGPSVPGAPPLPGGPSARAAGDAMRGALGASRNQGEDGALPPVGQGSGPDIMGMLGSLFSRQPQQPGGPGDLPPMARGTATAPPDDAMPSPSANGSLPPGIALGSMPQGSSDPNLLAMFAQSGQPASRGMQMPTAAGGAPRPPGAQAPQATGGGNLPDMLASMGSNPIAQVLIEALRGGMMGAGATPASPNAGPMRTVGIGFTAADQAAQKRKQAEAAAKRQASLDKLAFNKDARADQELGLKRNKDGREDRAESRKAEESRVKNQVAVEKLMRVRADGTLPVDARFKLQDQLIRYADKINKNGLMQPAELDAALAKEQQRLETYYGVRQPSAQATPVTRRARDASGKEVTLTLKDGQWVQTP